MRETLFLILVLVSGFSAPLGAEGWAYQNSPGAVAKALNVDAGVVAAAGRESLPPELCWMVAKMAASCGCGVDGVMKLRETRSWGEVARACGLEWVALNDQVHRLQQQGTIAFEQSSRLQLRLAGVNRASQRQQLRAADREAKARRKEARP